jgi:ferredoxin
VKIVGICEGIEPEGFRVQADGKVQVLVGDFEDTEVLEVAHEAVGTVHVYAPKTDMR